MPLQYEKFKLSFQPGQELRAQENFSQKKRLNFIEKFQKQREVQFFKKRKPLSVMIS